MRGQWRSIVFWVSAILAMVIATLVYQPAAARTGSLLVWTRDRIYIMDIDTLNLERIGLAKPDQLVVPSPGCFGQTRTVCWVAIDNVIYQVEVGAGGNEITAISLPVEPGFQWAKTAGWSPDGLHFAYFLTATGALPAELYVYNVVSGQLMIQASGVDPSLAPAWTSECAAGLAASGCKLGYKKLAAPAEGQPLPALISFTPATNEARQWTISPEEIFELRWSPEGTLLYSRPKRHFLSVEDHTPAYLLPPGARLANMSPNGFYTVYYQPFALKDCQPVEAADSSEGCLHLGIWLAQPGVEPKLIYSVDLSQVEQTEGLNFVPTWSPNGRAFVLFQGGRLIHYDLEKGEATIWYKPLSGKLRSLPVFSLNEEAVAFVDDQGPSGHRLLVINPKLEPLEHVVYSEKSFKVLAWLPQ